MQVLLLGHPVDHSLSPVMQNAAFAAAGLPHRYHVRDVEPEDIEAAVADLRAQDCLGANVTVPHKLAVIPGLDSLDAESETLGAVNTIVNVDGRLEGHNTDVEGVWRGLLEPVLESVGDAHIVLAGAGGGARAVMAALGRILVDAPGTVVVVARSVDEAARVAALGAGFGISTGAGAWDEMAEACEGAQVLVNCTPLGLHGEDPFAGVSLTGRVALDLGYAAGGTPLIRRARAEGATRAVQGDQMLLHQGAEGFRLWTGQEPPIEAMALALSEAIG
ncbi:MAG TPA: shikimate dehydrogenase [Candidatus Solibacter sp.]|jgi:shikimate dehydrogenase|nr:shikimate dehydrogenase [Candidatus Solibacter sp.]